MFTRRGNVNFHNVHVWAYQNRHEIRPHSFKTKFSVNVWLGVLGGHFLPPRLSLEHFLCFLEEDFSNYFLSPVMVSNGKELGSGVTHTFLEGGLGVRLGCQSRATFLTQDQLSGCRALQI